MYLLTKGNLVRNSYGSSNYDFFESDSPLISAWFDSRMEKDKSILRS